MNEIKELNKKYNELRKDVEFKIGSYAEEFFKDKLEDFFLYFKELSKDVIGYGDSFKIVFPVLGKGGKEVDFVLIFSPWEIDEKLVKGIFKEFSDKGDNLYYTFYYDFLVEEEAFNLDEKSIEKSYYIGITSFLFLQIYDKKDLIINMLKNEIKKTLKKGIEYEAYLSFLCDKIS